MELEDTVDSELELVLLLENDSLLIEVDDDVELEKLDSELIEVELLLDCVDKEVELEEVELLVDMVELEVVKLKKVELEVTVEDDDSVLLVSKFSVLSEELDEVLKELLEVDCNPVDSDDELDVVKLKKVELDVTVLELDEELLLSLKSELLLLFDVELDELLLETETEELELLVEFEVLDKDEFEVSVLLLVDDVSNNSVLLELLDEVVKLKKVEEEDNGISLLEVLKELDELDELELTELWDELELSVESLLSNINVELELLLDVVKLKKVEEEEE